MSDQETLTVTDELSETLKIKFQSFLEGLSDEENELFAAMVAGGQQGEDEEVSGYWYNWGGWGNWWNQSNSFVATNGGTWVSTNTGNFRGW